MIRNQRRLGVSDFIFLVYIPKSSYLCNHYITLVMKQILRTLTFAQVITYLQLFSLWLLVFAMPFRIGKYTRLLPTIAMSLAIVCYFAEYIINKRWKDFQWTRNSWLYVAMIAFYLFIFIWHLGTLSSSRLFSRIAEQRIPFLLCGIIGLLGFNSKVRLRHIAYVFTLSSIILSLYVILWGVGWKFFTLPFTEQARTFWEARSIMINSHMVFNLYLNTSLICIFYLLHREIFVRKIRILLFLAAGWIYYIICLTEGRIGLTTAFLLGGIYIIIYLYRISKTKACLLLLAYIVGGVLLLTMKPRLQRDKVFKDPRIVIWKASWHTVQEHSIVGQGVYDARMSFIKNATQDIAQLDKNDPMNIPALRYLEGRVIGDERRVHPHNAFLETWSEFGLIGLFTLLFLFIYPIILAPKQTRIYVIMIVACFGLQYTFDVFLSPLVYCLTIICFTSQSVIYSGRPSQKPDAT